MDSVFLPNTLIITLLLFCVKRFFVNMVKFADAGSWLIGLLAAVGTLVRAANNIVPGAFIIEFADGVVSNPCQRIAE